MRARYTYNVGYEYQGLNKTLYGTVQGTDQLDALENARWLNPTAIEIRIIEDLDEEFIARPQRALRGIK